MNRFIIIHDKRVDFPEGDWPCIGSHVRTKLPEWEMMGRSLYLDDSAPGGGGISYESLAKPIGDSDVIPWGSKVVALPHARS
jgi:hypothetical protein